MRMNFFYAVLALFLTALFAACTVSGDEETIGGENAMESVNDDDEEESDESSNEEDESSEDEDEDSGHNSGGNKIKVSASCPDDYPLLDEDGNCHSCDDDEIFDLHDEEDCERICNGKNGTTKRVNVFWGCKLEKCPDNKPLEDTFGDCRSCDYESPVSDTKNCSKCPERSVQNGECFFKSCTGRPLINYNGFCYSCSTKLSVQMSEGECSSACPNREENGTWNFTFNGKRSEGVWCDLKN